MGWQDAPEIGGSAPSGTRVSNADQLARDKLALEVRRAELARATGPARQVLAREVAASEASVNSGNPWINGSRRGDPLPSVVLGGTTRTAQAAPAASWADAPVVADAPAPSKAPEKSGARSMAEGALRGVAGIGDTILTPLQKVVPGAVGDYLRRIPEAMKWLDADNADSTAYDVGKVGAQIAATLPVGGVLGAGVKAVAGGARLAAAAPRTAQALQAIGNAAQTGGLSAGGVKGAAGLGARVAGGALAGGAAAGLTGGDDQDTAQAAMIGGLLPVGFGAAGKAAALGTGLIKPLTGKGQGQIVGDILRQYSHDPDAALAALRQYTGPMVPGSVPITSAAAGDVGLSGLTRTMQAANNQVANEIAMRGTAQNAARAGLLESMAGTPAQMEAAKEARRVASAALREKALADAGSIESGKVLGALDQFIADPNNAGATARAALERVRKQVADVAGDTGRIDARALYEIRKDIGLAMQGKLQGDAGNLRHAKGVLDQVQSRFDDLIGGAIPETTEVALPGQARALDPWRQYLANYAEHSKPINQMEQLQEVLRRVQTGTTDMQGNAVISAAKLNNLLKNDAGGLSKLLTPEQMANLRAVQADLNAGRLGLEAGRPVGSNTAQNITQAWLLNRVLGKYGENPAISAAMAAKLNPINWVYNGANEQITDQLGQALLNPELARTLMEQATKRAAPRGLLSTSARPAAVRGLLSQD
jgi:hypothetical protein